MTYIEQLKRDREELFFLDIQLNELSLKIRDIRRGIKKREIDLKKKIDDPLSVLIVDPIETERKE